MKSNMKLTIKHDSKAQKFFCLMGGKECCLKYEKINDYLLNFKLLYVPKNLRDQGVANAIMEYALSYAKRNFMKIKSSCSYVEQYFLNHKEHEPLIYTNQTPLFKGV